MKLRCTISHERPLGDGRFAHYEAGAVYDVALPVPSRYFEPVEEDGKTDEEEPES